MSGMTLLLLTLWFTQRIRFFGLAASIGCALLCWPAVGQAQLRNPQAVQQQFRVDEQGRRFRIVFPRHDRLSALAAFSPGNGARFALEPKIELEADFPGEEIWWRMRHRFLSLSYSTDVAASDDLQFEIVRARYLRHDNGSYILMPLGKGNLKLPAPFDIALDYRLARFRWDSKVGDAGVTGLKAIDVAEFAPMADWIRDESFRHRFAFGPLAHYRIGDMKTSTNSHQLVPFSGARLLYGYETANGLFSFRVKADLYHAFHVRDDTLTRSWIAEGTGDIEWIVFALNNQPFSLVAKGNARLLDDTVQGEAEFGLRFSFLL